MLFLNVIEYNGIHMKFISPHSEQTIRYDSASVENIATSLAGNTSKFLRCLGYKDIKLPSSQSIRVLSLSSFYKLREFGDYENLGINFNYDRSSFARSQMFLSSFKESKVAAYSRFYEYIGHLCTSESPSFGNTLTVKNCEQLQWVSLSGLLHTKVSLMNCSLLKCFLSKRKVFSLQIEKCPALSQLTLRSTCDYLNGDNSFLGFIMSIGISHADILSLLGNPLYQFWVIIVILWTYTNLYVGKFHSVE
jgi:hypothetical protein